MACSYKLVPSFLFHVHVTRYTDSLESDGPCCECFCFGLKPVNRAPLVAVKKNASSMFSGPKNVFLSQKGKNSRGWKIGSLEFTIVIFHLDIVMQVLHAVKMSSL